MTATEMIANHLEFLPITEGNLVGYTLSDNANGDAWKNIVVLFNGNLEEKEVELPDGTWTIVVNEDEVAENGLGTASSKLTVPANSAMVLMNND